MAVGIQEQRKTATQIPVHAVLTPGSPVTTTTLQQWIDAANKVYRSVDIELRLDSTETVSDPTLANDTLPPPAMLHVQRQLFASKYPGKVVIFCTPGGGGAGSSEADYVIMRGGHPNLFPHELGHFLHLNHTHGVVPTIRDYMLDIFVRGNNSRLNQLSYSNLPSATPPSEPAWSAWKEDTDGFQMLSDPAVDSMAPNHLHVFALGPDRALWQKWRVDNSWSQWIRHDGGEFPAGARPSVVSRQPTITDIVMRGMDNRLWQRSFSATANPQWTPWTAHDGFQLGSDPAIDSMNGNHVHVFARGTNGQLWQKWWTQDSGWSNWISHGGQFQGSPTVISRMPTVTDIFVRGLDNRLQQISFVAEADPQWSGWINHNDGFVLASDPIVGSMAPNHLHLFARGADGELWMKWYLDGSPWTEWRRISDWRPEPSKLKFSGTPAVCSRRTGTTEIEDVARMVKEYVEQNKVPAERGLDVFDGDGLSDTPPDTAPPPFQPYGGTLSEQCSTIDRLTFAVDFPTGSHFYTLKPDRSNVLSYFHACSAIPQRISNQQRETVRRVLEQGNRRRLIAGALVQRLTAYSWPDGHSKQVAYVGRDQHVHELFATVDEGWQHADLTAVSQALVEDIVQMTGFSWQAGQSKQVVYVTASGGVRELFLSKGGHWGYGDLTGATGAPAASRKFITAFAWGAGGSKQVCYVTNDGHIHELFVTVGGKWQHIDLTAVTGAPKAASPYLAGYAWEQGGTKQVAYVGEDGHIYELFVPNGGSWRYGNLTGSTKAPKPAHPYLNGYSWPSGGSKQVTYLDKNGHIHELWITKNANWQHIDLTSHTGAPPSYHPYINGYASDARKSKHIAYFAADWHIHELSVASGGSWGHEDVSAKTGVSAGTPEREANTVAVGYWWPDGNSKQIVFVDPNGQVLEMFKTAQGSWARANLTALTGHGPTS
jgi:hypothetical protein